MRLAHRRFATIARLTAAVASLASAASATSFASAATTTIEGTLPEAGVAWVSDGSHPAPTSGRELRNRQKTFVPDLVVVTVGSDVRFPNDDDFFHSIFSSGGADPFDIGFYDNGPGKDVVFTKAGIVSIRCHIHGSMHATIVVVDGPSTQTHDPNERYRIAGVLAGRHVVHEWTPALGERTHVTGS